MMRQSSVVFYLILFAFLLGGCATFKSDLNGKFEGPGSKNYNTAKVNVLFIIKHYRQMQGWDSIPKLEYRRQIVRGFNDLFIDACQEFSNLDKYSTFTDYSSDISDPDRRVKKDSLVAANDYIIRMKFNRNTSFPKRFFGNLITYSTLSVFPIPYSKHYNLEVNVYDSEDELISNYSRSAHTTKWVQTFMLFLYPFHPEKRKEEEIYRDMMHDIFKQIEVEKVLK